MKVTFLGAARMVTGSCFLIETDQARVLVDCGMFQGSRLVQELNRRPFLFTPSSLSAVVLTHAHIDHSGLLPKLFKEGYRGPIHATKVTHELCAIMLPDSAHIQELDTETVNRKGARAGRPPLAPVYSVEDAEHVLEQFVSHSYHTMVSIAPGISVRFQIAGHIMGAAMVEVYIEENGKTVKLLFSGDIGQPGQPILRDPEAIERTDYLIMESTYGDRAHPIYDKGEALAKVVNETVERGGRLIIPSFAVGRTQVLLYHLQNLFKEKKIPSIPVIIDSPLAINATNIVLRNPQEYDEEAANLYEKQHRCLMDMPQLRFTRTSDESRALNELEGPAIIISASGMADAGRVLHHLKHNLWRPEASILFVGFQAEGSLGRRLVDGAKRVKVLGEQISVRANIYDLEGFSAHADQEQLIEWLKNLSCRPTNLFIVHGEYDAARQFAEVLQKEFGFSTYIPQYGETAVIEGSEWRVEETAILQKIPAIKEIRDHLRVFERNYFEYKARIEQLVSKDANKLPEVVRRLEKIKKMVDRTFEDL